MNFKILWGILFILILGCSINYDIDSVNGLNIYAVLNNIMDTQRIYIDSIANINAGDDTIYSIFDANVFINDKECIYFSSDSGEGYYIYTDSLIYGNEYTLNIIFNNDSIELTTVMPYIPEVYYPYSNSIIIIDSLSFAFWKNVSEYYIFTVREIDDSLPRFSFLTRDTVISLYSISELLNNDTYCNITITTVDSNFVNYRMGYDELDNNNRGTFSSFCSTVIESVKIEK